MGFWKDSDGSDITEHIVLLGIVLSVAGGIVWAVYEAVAGRFADILNRL